MECAGLAALFKTLYGRTRYYKAAPGRRTPKLLRQDFAEEFDRARIS